uniref:Uncharacterized protein n=1 Tax=Rhizophagus irregularis (strain DAOM 181602 / DAOM 197198 / MUCL 43194) TaxID=747089 RepID=U9TBS2_RHIID
MKAYVATYVGRYNEERDVDKLTGRTKYLWNCSASFSASVTTNSQRKYTQIGSIDTA